MAASFSHLQNDHQKSVIISYSDSNTFMNRVELVQNDIPYCIIDQIKSIRFNLFVLHGISDHIFLVKEKCQAQVDS